MATGFTQSGKYQLYTGSVAQTDPTTALGVATKQYVDINGSSNGTALGAADAVTSGLSGTSPQNLSGAYVSGAGTLTGNTALSVTVGAITSETVALHNAANLVLGSYVFLTGQTAPAQNGLYTVTTLGVNNVTQWVLTRASGYATTTALVLGKKVDLRAGTITGMSAAAQYVWQLQQFSTFAAAQSWQPILDAINPSLQGARSLTGPSRGRTAPTSGAIDLKQEVVLLNPTGAGATGMLGAATFTLPSAVGTSVAADYEGMLIRLYNMVDDTELPGVMHIGATPASTGATGKTAKVDLGSGLIAHTNGTPASDTLRYLYIGPKRFAELISDGSRWVLYNYSQDGNVQTHAT
jgi:hypothetical protein